MMITPTSASSLSIGTPTRDRAPPSFADGPETASAASSAVYHLLCPHNAIDHRGVRCGLKRSTSPHEFGKLRRRTDFCREVESIAVEAVQHAELGLADAGGILKHGLEHRLQFAGRRTDDPKHIGRSSLLLQRLPQLVQ